MQLVQNEIIISLCADSKHTFLISFYVNGIRSVSNDKHFVNAMIGGIIIQFELLNDF